MEGSTFALLLGLGRNGELSEVSPADLAGDDDRGDGPVPLDFDNEDLLFFSFE